MDEETKLYSTTEVTAVVEENGIAEEDAKSPGTMLVTTPKTSDWFAVLRKMWIIAVTETCEGSVK